MPIASHTCASGDNIVRVVDLSASLSGCGPDRRWQTTPVLSPSNLFSATTICFRLELAVWTSERR